MIDEANSVLREIENAEDALVEKFQETKPTTEELIEFKTSYEKFLFLVNKATNLERFDTPYFTTQIVRELRSARQHFKSKYSVVIDRTPNVEAEVEADLDDESA